MKEKFISIKHSDLSVEMLNVIIGLKQQHWHHTYESQKKWIDNNLESDDVHLLLQVDNQYVAYLCICNLDISIDSAEMHGKGLSNVCVSKNYQKFGYGKKLVEKASKLIQENDDIGILLCHKHLVPFYKKCGWTDVNYENIEVGKKAFSDVVMFMNYAIDSISYMSLNRNF